MERIAKIQGFRINLYTIDEVLDFLFDTKYNAHVVTVNPEIIQSAKKNKELFDIINDAELITPDGVGIRLALKMKGINQEAVTGYDLTLRILELASKRGLNIAIVGAKPENLELAVKNINLKYEGVNVVYAHDGYFTAFDDIIASIEKSGAKFLFCAMGSPKQEFFISRLKQKLKDKQTGLVMIGVGGTIDVLSGQVKLAPKFFRKIGLEWLYRTLMQPERFKRIFPTLPLFFFQSIIDSVRR